ncbi:MAG: hypothetical protein M3680_07685 [Myxococcota bacterium]|nr:hypothetical protein [Myxococcota bacterium]
MRVLPSDERATSRTSTTSHVGATVPLVLTARTSPPGAAPVRGWRRLALVSFLIVASAVGVALVLLRAL